MKRNHRLLSLLLAVIMVACLFPVLPRQTVSAAPELRGGITNVDLVIDHEPAMGTINGVDYRTVPWGAAPEEGQTKYEVGYMGQNDPNFHNGVAWYNVTKGRYLHYGDQFYHFDVYRVEIVVHITGPLVSGRVPVYSSLFQAYGEDENWIPAVTATIRGSDGFADGPREATVSPYKDEEIGTHLLISYTYKPTLYRSKDVLDVVEAHIDEPRVDREASYEARLGDYTGSLMKGGYDITDETKDGFTNGVKWVDVTDPANPVMLAPGDKFVQGHDYRVTIKLVRSYTGEFDVHRSFLNGVDIVAAKAQGQGSEDDGVWYMYVGKNRVSKCCFLDYTFKSIKGEATDYASFQVYGIAGPIAGAAPENYPRVSVKCDNSPGSNVEITPTTVGDYCNDTQWVYTDTYYPVPADVPFQKGVKYTLLVPVRTTGYVSRFSVRYDAEKEKYVNDMWSEFFPDLGESVVGGWILTKDDYRHSAVLHFDFPPCKEIAGTEGFTAQTPKEGEVARASVTRAGETASYGARNVYWYDETAQCALGNNDKFIANHRYSLLFEVYTNPTGSYLLLAGRKGGLFDLDGKTIPEYVNGTRDAVVSYKTNYAANSGPWHAFTVRVDMGVCNDSVIEEIALRIAPPTAGAKPSYQAVNLGSGYHVRTEWSGSVEEYWKNPITYRYYGRNGVQWWPTDTGAQHLYEDEVFEEGQRYTVTIYVETDDGYEFAQNDGEATVVAKVNGQLSDPMEGGTNGKTRQSVTYTFTCAAATGYRVSGTVTSADAPADSTTIQLFSPGAPEPSYETEAKGTEAHFSLENVPAGNYTVKISKPGYVTQTLSIQVTGDHMMAGIALKKLSSGESDVLWGDANGDGVVSSKDIVRLKNYFANYNDSTGTSTVEIFPGADANGDGIVSSKDIVRLKNYFANYDDKTGKSTVNLGPS